MEPRFEDNYEGERIGIYYDKEDAIKQLYKELEDFKSDIKEKIWNVENPKEEKNLESEFSYLRYGNDELYKFWEIYPIYIYGNANKELCKDLLKLDVNSALALIEKIAYDS
jgi:hypothetical protein